MTTRSGTLYGVPHTCNVCASVGELFYSRPEYNHKCSRCFRTSCTKEELLNLLEPEATEEEVEEWVKSKLISREDFGKMIRFAERRQRGFLSAMLYSKVYENSHKPPYHGRWLSAEMAYMLITALYGHIGTFLCTQTNQIMSNTIDWWNIRYYFGNNSTHNCYYGHFDSPRPTSLPPKIAPNFPAGMDRTNQVFENILQGSI